MGGAPGITTDTSISLMAESAAKDRELNQVQDMYERSLQTLEDDLRATRDEADNLKQECVYVDNECASLQWKMLKRKMFLLYPPER